MAHKTLISGTAYSVTGGRELIGGTGYGCKAGKTIIGGTAFEVKFSEPITVTIHGEKEFQAGTQVKIGDLIVSTLGTYETSAGTEITARVGANHNSIIKYEKIYYNDELVSEWTSGWTTEYSFIAKGNIDILVQAVSLTPYVANIMKITEV